MNNKTTISYRRVPLDAIHPADDFIPSTSDAAADLDLSRSIQHFGIIEPLAVAFIRKNHYVVIDGYRRYRTAHQLRLKTVPCVIHESLTDDEIMMLRFTLHHTVKLWTKAERADVHKRLHQIDKWPTTR